MKKTDLLSFSLSRVYILLDAIGEEKKALRPFYHPMYTGIWSIVPVGLEFMIARLFLTISVILSSSTDLLSEAFAILLVFMTLKHHNF